VIYGMDENRNKRKKDLAIAEEKARCEEELEEARQRARLSVLKLTPKDVAFLRALKVEA